MKRQKLQLAKATLFCAGAVVLASCNNEPKAPLTAAAPRTDSAVVTKPGVAGGVVEDVFIAEAIVSGIDLPSRRVTLKGPQGNELTFTARPEIKNLPQLKVGDKVTATFARRMVVMVRSDEAAPRGDRSSLMATARPGDRPGVLVAEETERVARVIAIDPAKRLADLQFSDGIVKSVPVRADVDLSRYKISDSVVIRLTSALTVLTQTQ